MRLAPMAPMVLVALVAGLPARAAEVPADCAADAKRFCATEVAGDDVRCLKQHQSQLLPGCKKSLAGQAKTAAIICRSDIERFCADVQPGSGRLGKCLMPHHNELSPRCRSAVGSL